jgi:hypothetical protein
MSSIFTSKHLQPTDEMLGTALGKTKELFDSIVFFIETKFDECHTEWKYYGLKIGWSVKILNKKRNILFASPENGYFRIAFAFGEKAFQEIIKSNLPDSIKQQLHEAKIYVEGRPLRLEIRKKEDLDPLYQLIRIKLDS